MVRVLQLLDNTSDFEAQRSAEQLADGLGADFGPVLQRIGTSGEWRGASAAIIGLRRQQVFDVVHCWGPTALTAAALATSAPLVYSPGGEASDRSLRWLRAVMGYRPVHVTCGSASLRRRVVESGVPLDRCHLIRPAVSFARIQRRSRGDLRGALGFSAEDHVLLAVGESTRAADHRDALWAAAILYYLDGRYKLLTWGRGRLATALQRFGRGLGRNGFMIAAEARLGREVEFEDLAVAADLGLVTAGWPVATLPIAIAMAAQLPLVGTATPLVSELLEDRHTALLVPPHSPRQMARKAMQLHEDAALRRRLADQARVEAYEYLAQSRMLERYRAIYAQVAAGQPVDLSEPNTGGGLRFHGTQARRSASPGAK